VDRVHAEKFVATRQPPVGVGGTAGTSGRRPVYPRETLLTESEARVSCSMIELELGWGMVEWPPK